MRNKRKFLLIILIFIYIIFISATASAKEVTVDDDSGADFRSIQEAVNNSVPGDTIIVKPGTYTENILVSVSGLTIRSESKNNDWQVKSLESVLKIESDNVMISGFDIGEIHLENARNCIIKGNKMSLSVHNASYNTISENLFLDGISLDAESSMNNLTGNTINGSITLYAGSSGNLIAENKINGRDKINGAGVDCYCCGYGNFITGNTISNFSSGIYAYDQGVNIRNNRITDCHYGIELSSASAGIDDNTILNCDVGIHLGEEYSYVDIINNTIMYSAECGIFIPDYESGELIYNNYFNNTLNVRLGTDVVDTWNNSLVSGTNIAGGPYIGGNFWAKPDGTGFSQTCADMDGNGIGDVPYNIYEDEFDYLPLVSLSSPQNSVTLTANFISSATNGSAPLAVKFTDFSKNAIAWNWDFDGDEISDSTKQNPVYVYRTPGNYTVNLTASNGNNTSSKLANITVEKRVSSTWPFVYITNQARDTVSLIDTATGIVITTVKVGRSPLGIAVTPNGKTAYVANHNSNTVSIINTETNIVTATVPVGIGPYGVAASPDGTKVYVTNCGSYLEHGYTVTVIDTATNTVTATINVGSNPHGIAVTPDGSKVYVTDSDSNTVSVIDTSTNTVTATVNLEDYTSPGGVAVNPDGTKVYVANAASSNVSVIDTATNNVTATVNVGKWPLGIAVTPDGRKVYVAGGYVMEDGFVSVIDTATRKVITTVNVGGWPYGIAVTPDGKKVYVVNGGGSNGDSSGNNAISLIDISNNTVSATVNIERRLLGGIAIIPESEPKSVLPTVNFSSNVSEGFAPLSVQFTGSSNNATELNWDFGDGTTSTEQNPTHRYSTVGTYTINLIATNENGTASKTAIVVVSQAIGDNSGSNGTLNGGNEDSPIENDDGSSSSDSSHSSHSSDVNSGGGGACESPEPQSNVGAREISQTFITSGSAVKFNFPQKATPVLYLSFDSKKTAEKTTTIVEMLKGKSALIIGLPSGEVYKYLNIWVGNSGFGNSNNIANAVINFKVEKIWIKDKSIDQSSITLNRYSDKEWNQLSTNLSGEDDKYLCFTAETSGYSSFAITGKTIATGTAVQPATGNKAPSAVADTQNNAGNTTANIDQTPERTQSSNTSGKECTKTPDFEITSGIVCLLSVFLYKRR